MTAPACGWFELPDIFDGGETERCTSGKPATFRNCGFAVPVCEDHRCRCIQGAMESHGRMPHIDLPDRSPIRAENVALKARIAALESQLATARADTLLIAVRDAALEAWSAWYVYRDAGLVGDAMQRVALGVLSERMTALSLRLRDETKGPT